MNFEDRKKIYLDYIRLKTHEEDWHGVSDAANDLRELYLEQKIINEFKNDKRLADLMKLSEQISGG